MTIRDGSGRSSSGWFAEWVRDGCWWRTSQGSLFEGWTKFSEAWPRAGLMLNGRAYRLPRLVRPISGGASSSPHVADFPTPAATPYGSSGNGEGNNRSSRGRPSLEMMARRGLWPTPVARDRHTLRKVKRGGGSLAKGNQKILPLAVAVESSSETSRQAFESGGQLNPRWVEWLMGFPDGWTDLED